MNFKAVEMRNRVLTIDFPRSQMHLENLGQWEVTIKKTQPKKNPQPNKNL